MTGAPIVYVEGAGPAVPALRAFYTACYLGVADITATLASITAVGGTVVIPRTVVPNVVTFALLRDPAGNLLGLAETGSFPDAPAAS